MLIDEINKRLLSLTESQQRQTLEYIQSIHDAREYARVKKRIEFVAAVGDQVIQSDTRDISASGAFVYTNTRLKNGSDAVIVFSVPGGDRPFKLKSRVVRAEEEGAAFVFSDMAFSSQKALDEVLLS